MIPLSVTTMSVKELSNVTFRSSMLVSNDAEIYIELYVLLQLHTGGYI